MIKQALTTTPILAIFNPRKPFELEIDASDKTIASILIQEGRPTAFVSKKLDKAQ